MNRKASNILTRNRLKIFILTILISMLPIVILPVYSHFYHAIWQVPDIDEGVLDLTGYESSWKKEIPLDGEWEFFYDKQLISDQGQQEESKNEDHGSLVQVPGSWKSYRMWDGSIPKGAVSSYRLQIKNCPRDMSFVVHIPNITAKYKAYINGSLCSVRTYNNEDMYSAVSAYGRIKQSVEVEKGEDIEVIVVLESSVIKGIYTTPYLAEMQEYQQRLELRKFISNCYVGIFIVLILYFFYIIIQHQYTMEFIILFIIDVLVLLRLLEKDEFYEITGRILPFLKDYRMVSCIQILTLFLPIAILYCGKKILYKNIKPYVIRNILIYEFVVACFVGMFAWNGMPMVQYLFVLISYLPFIVIVRQLFEQMKQQDIYSLIDAAALLFALASITGSNMNLSGILIVNVSLFPPTCFMISLMLQLILYVNQNKKIYIKALEAENLTLQLEQKEISLMMSQIKPHFLYNTLVTIQVLCTEEPETAAEAVSRFSQYLRRNMKFVQGEKLILFKQELSHIENYVYIERLRFGSRLEVKLDIGISDFMIPPLCIQPLVENAIKHGACKRLDGEGMVKIKTYRRKGDVYIVVTDNGPGFLTEKLEQKKDSYGISNISFRLKELLDADITFKRTDGETEISVHIPGKEQNEDHID